MKQLVIFGIGGISEAISYYFNRDSDYEIVAYACDRQYLQSGTTFLSKPVIETNEVMDMYTCDKYHMFVAMGYQGLNGVRTDRYNLYKEHGYKFANYKSPYVRGDYTIGDNSIVMDDVVIQPCVSIKNNTLVWGGTMIGHHTNIGNNCYLTGSCAIGGKVNVGDSSFIGLNASIGNEITIGKNCLIGAHTLCVRSIPDKTVLIKEQTPAHRLNSEQFTNMSSCFKP